MLKSIFVFLLLIIILGSFSIIIFSVMAKSSEDNFFNVRLRPIFAEYPLVRSILHLNSSGDGANDYMGTKYSKIVIEVDIMEGLTLKDDVLKSLSEKIANVTGKEVRYVFSDKLPFSENTSFNEIVEFEKRRNFKNSNEDASLYLLYVKNYEDNETQVGMTYKEYGMVLFDEALKTFSQNHPENLPNYIMSTALHEFGHQLGLEHNDRGGCLMLPVVDDYDFWADEGIVTDFCDYERDLILNMKNG